MRMKIAVSLLNWVKKHYFIILLSSLLGGLLTGIWTVTPGEIIAGHSTAITFLMILVISLTITPQQFVQAFHHPKAIFISLGINFMIMPVLCWGMTKIFVPDPILATGIILLGVVPSAVNASIWTSLLDGNTSISLATNALTMLLATFLIPPLLLLFTGASVEMDTGELFRDVAFLLLTPLVIGTMLRWLLNSFLEPYIKNISALSSVLAIIMVFGISNENVPLIFDQWRMLPALFAAIGPIAPLSFTVSYLISHPLLPRNDMIAVTYAGSMKNISVAIGLALASFSSSVGLPLIIAVIPQLITAGLVFKFFGQSSTSKKEIQKQPA
jgi:predicted Na+-dependent transporter